MSRSPREIIEAIIRADRRRIAAKLRELAVSREDARTAAELRHVAFLIEHDFARPDDDEREVNDALASDVADDLGDMALSVLKHFATTRPTNDTHKKDGNR